MELIMDCRWNSKLVLEAVCVLLANILGPQLITKVSLEIQTLELNSWTFMNLVILISISYGFIVTHISKDDFYNRFPLQNCFLQQIIKTAVCLFIVKCIDNDK